MRKLRINEVGEQLGVTGQSVRRYVNDGRLKCDYTPSGQRVFTQEYVDEFLGKTLTPVYAYYVRSSSGSKELLASQKEQLTQSFGEAVSVFEDKGSGLNTNRKGLHRMLSAAKEGKFTHLAITQKDRLSRFGYEYLELLLAEYNITIIVLHEVGEKSLQEELLQDFMSLVASFSGKFYRLRGYEQQRALLQKATDTLP